MMMGATRKTAQVLFQPAAAWKGEQPPARAGENEIRPSRRACNSQDGSDAGLMAHHRDMLARCV